MDVLPALKLFEEYLLAAMGIAIMVIVMKLYNTGFYRTSAIFIGTGGFLAFLWKLVFLVHGETSMTTMFSEVFEGGFAVFIALGVIFYTSHIYAQYSRILESESSFLQSIIDSVAEPIMVVGTDYRIKLMNLAANEISKKRSERSTPYLCYQIFYECEKPCDELKKPCPLVQVRESGRPVMVVHEHQTSGGGVRYIEILASPLYREDGNFEGIIESSREITERKYMEEDLKRHREHLEEQVRRRTDELTKANEHLRKEIDDRRIAEEALHKSEEKYRNLIENIQDGVFLIQDSKIQFTNESFARMAGYTAEEVIGKDFRELVAPEDLEMVSDRYHRRQAGENILQDYSFSVLHKDGKTRIIVNMNVGLITYRGRVASMGTVKDITESRNAEKALRESEERYRSLVESAKDAIFTVSPDYRITSLNPAFGTITGFSPADWVGRNISPLIRPDDLPHVKEHCKRTMNERTTENFELYVLSKSGNYVTMETTITPQIQDSKVVGILGIARDITERKKGEKLRFQNERLLLVSKAKSEFIGTISHELRTPLTSILGYSELLKDKKVAGELNEKQEYFVDKVLANSKHLLELINDILDLSKIEEGKIELVMERFSVPEAIDETVSLIKEMASRRNVIIKKDLESIDLEADKRRFKQILLNLLSNAVKFSKPDGGFVTITARKAGVMAHISVSDTGIGIKKEDMKRLFWVFEQLDSGVSRKYGGTGLGLAISKKLVELHGGTIDVQSDYGKGSTITYSLPLKTPKDHRLNDNNIWSKILS